MKKYYLLLAVLFAVPCMSFAQISPAFPISACLQFNQTMGEGSSDIGTQGQVSKYQQFLVNQGYENVIVNGYFDGYTEAGTTYFQGDNNIFPITGVVGQMTIEKIKVLTCRYNVSPVRFGAAVPSEVTAVRNDQMASAFNSILALRPNELRQEKVLIEMQLTSSVAEKKVGAAIPIAARCAAIARTLKYGDSGKDVEEAQKILEKQGFLVMPPGVPYGTYGQKTTDGLKNFLKSKGVEGDGKVLGPKALSLFMQTCTEAGQTVDTRSPEQAASPVGPMCPPSNIKVLGDFSLNGKIGPEDYVIIDRGFRMEQREYLEGNINCKDGIDFDDYVLLDKLFNQQQQKSRMLQPVS